MGKRHMVQHSSMGVFHVFLSCANGTKSHNASYMQSMLFLKIDTIACLKFLF